jgi:diguanylate cyclase (GGDEF)-like protein
MNGHQLDQNDILERILERLPQLDGWTAGGAAVYLLGSNDPRAKKAIRELCKRYELGELNNTSEYWDRIDHWLEESAFERCLGFLKTSGNARVLTLLEIGEEQIQTTIDAWFRHLADAKRSEPDYALVDAIWLLGQGSERVVRRNISRFKPTKWLERYELSVLAQRHGIPDIETCSSDIQPTRPQWAPTPHPLCFRDPLTGAIPHRILIASESPDLIPLEPMTTLPCQWLMYADLDDLRRMNSYYGWLAGDLALKSTVNALQTLVGDRVIRMGGEEFAILYEGDDGPDIAERARCVVEETQFGPVGFGRYARDREKLTISLGVAQAGNTVETLSLADRALYEAKLAGKNRVVSA